MEIAIVWLVALVVGALLWHRFTRPPTAPMVPVPGQQVSKPSRVVPLWLVLVLLILLVAAIWLTFTLGDTARAP